MFTGGILLIMEQKHINQRYPSDLSEAEWQLIEPLIPVKTGMGTGPGKPRTLNMRHVVNALLYLEHTRCQWRYLPKDFPNYNSVRYYFDVWRKEGIWQKMIDTLRDHGREFEVQSEADETSGNDSVQQKSLRSVGERQVEDKHYLVARN